MKLMKLYFDCIRKHKGMNEFNAYAESKALMGCGRLESLMLDYMYKSLVASKTPTLVVNGYASPF